jgi:hypothetical protein
MTNINITDLSEKKKAKEEFAALVKSDMDALFARELSPEEINTAVVGEVGKLMEEATIMNNIGSDLMASDTEALNDLKLAEKEVDDLKKQVQVREDLGLAA